MRYLVILALTVAGVVCDYEGGLRAPYGSYFELPKTLSEAKGSSWVSTDSVTRSLKGLTAYCYSDFIVCILYDDSGYAAGLQVALPKDKITGSPFKWEEQGFSVWKAPNGEDYWTTQVYFVDQDYLNKDPTSRSASRDPMKVLQLDNIWVTGFDKKLQKIPTTATGLTGASFVKKACYSGMGYHYTYKMTPDLPCTGKTLFPWFPLEYDGKVHGIGLFTYGKLPVSQSRDWFERLDRMGVEFAFPDSPKCFYDLVENTGLVTMHMYFIKNPEKVSCP